MCAEGGGLMQPVLPSNFCICPWKYIEFGFVRRLLDKFSTNLMRFGWKIVLLLCCFSVLHLICHHTILLECFWVGFIAYFRQQKNTGKCHHDILTSILLFLVFCVFDFKGRLAVQMQQTLDTKAYRLKFYTRRIF